MNIVTSTLQNFVKHRRRSIHELYKGWHISGGKAKVLEKGMNEVNQINVQHYINLHLWDYRVTTNQRDRILPFP